MADPVAIAGLSLGAVNALAGVLFGAYKLTIDRAKLKLSIANGLVPQWGVGTGDWMLILQATNVGRRPITVAGAGIEAGDKTMFIMESNPPAPCGLNEGQSITFYMPTKGLAEIPDAANSVQRAFATDAVGRRHRTRIPNGVREWIRGVVGEALASAPSAGGPPPTPPSA